MKFKIILVLISVLPGILAAIKRDPVACNNSPDLCSRTYDSITHLGAHDSPFVSGDIGELSLAANQLFDSPTQLSAGVRLLSGQIHLAVDGTWHLCHSYCELYDAGPLETWLGSIKAWLDSNPNEVVTILIVNNGADAETLDTIFKASGVVSYSYTPPSLSKPPADNMWPTLSSLISANTRLITFVQPLDPSSNTVAPYLLDEFTFVWENQYLDLNASSFSCAPNRPPSLASSSPAVAFSSGRLALLNHFLDMELLPGIDVPNEAQAQYTNAPLDSPNSGQGSLGVAAAACVAQWMRTPTFVLVDWFNLGPAIDTVDTLNGINDPVGRSGPGAVSSSATIATSNAQTTNSASSSLMTTMIVTSTAPVTSNALATSSALETTILTSLTTPEPTSNAATTLNTPATGGINC